MNDLLSPLSAPPPRYLLESDSSDEEGQGAYLSTSRRLPAAESARVDFHPLTSLDAVENVMIALGQAGRYLARRAPTGSKVLEITVGSNPLGAGFRLEGGEVLVLLDEPEESNGAAHEIATHVLGLLSLKNLTVVSIYVPSMYIPDPSKPILADPPIRHLSLSGISGGLETFDGPNFVSGIAGALLSLAVHPSTALLTNFDILLLPLPLSGLPPSSLPSALAAVQSKLSVSPRSSWDDDDDEPFFSKGMGGRRKLPTESTAPTVDLTSMYM